MSKYALKCIRGPLAGDWFRRRGCVVRMTKNKAATLAGKLNAGDDGMWLATKYRSETHNDAEDAGRS